MAKTILQLSVMFYGICKKITASGLLIYSDFFADAMTFYPPAEHKSDTPGECRFFSVFKCLLAFQEVRDLCAHVARLAGQFGRQGEKLGGGAAGLR